MRRLRDHDELGARRVVVDFLRHRGRGAGILVAASPARARVAAIETSAPLTDHSEQAIQLALTEAVMNAVRGAMAMGLTWVRLRDATVLADAVTVLIVATDAEPEDPKAADAEPQPTTPARIDL